MKNEVMNWNELTKLIKNEAFEVERVRIKRTGIAIEGRFELSSLIQITEEDQVFISAFLRSHGSIKEMERLFGISYPTVKARLNRIAEQLPFVETLEGIVATDDTPVSQHKEEDVLEQLNQGKINSAEAARRLRIRRGGK